MKITFDHEKWREKRLVEVQQTLIGKIDTRLIKEINDHKGGLTVTWYKKPNQYQQQIVTNVWQNDFNEVAIVHVW